MYTLGRVRGGHWARGSFGRAVAVILLLVGGCYLAPWAKAVQPSGDSVVCPFFAARHGLHEVPFRRAGSLAEDAERVSAGAMQRQRELRGMLEEANRLNDSDAIVGINVELADSPWHRNDPLGAHMHYKQAFDYLTPSASREVAFRIYYQLGLSYSRRHYHVEARRMLDSARSRLHGGCTAAERATLYLTLARLAQHQERHWQALADVLSALSVVGQSVGLRALVHNAASELYYTIGSPAYGRWHADEAIRCAEECGWADTVAEVMAVRAGRAYRLGQIALAHRFADMAWDALGRGSGRIPPIEIYSLQARLAAHEGQYDMALALLDKCHDLNDSLRREDTDIEFARYTLNNEYQLSWRQHLQRRIASEKKILASQRLNRSVVLLSSAVILLLLLGVYVMHGRLRAKAQDNAVLASSTVKMERINAQMVLRREELQGQQRAIEQNNRMLQSAHNHLSDNLSRISGHLDVVAAIQRSLLPPVRQMEKRLGPTLVYYDPCEPVSGDFYWWAKLSSTTLLAVVDCAGHGVPGGLMSFVGNILLNKIVRGWGITTPSEILINLHEQLQMYFGAISPSYTGHYSMDVCLVSIDTRRRSVVFSGAGSALYVLRGDTLERTRGSIMGVGSMLQRPIFKDHSFVYDEPTTLYLSTDGYADQLNEQNRKFSRAAFMRLLIEIHGLPIRKQRARLESALLKHMGYAERTDDICLVGIKLRT